ncbi:MAG: radical SAM protein [Candidatus Omnitrophota bacterium]|nr:radical SAM protein [Candidatus Omnitrophota bacterium]MBU1928350.1 radical SAM protein [Candidatus Omnitrophota bacterium]MBU2034331.1 radical SAM protein [Candidatus Omnitrophota bacterium]MBU2221531.1 radical SAM protein [Candidatus Omnitrophota bacterium]MBU2257728.1 radical SAM protein [Candidatus Omnitrophota bacterium]
MKDNVPRTCLLTVTNSCVLRCKMCNLWSLDTLDQEINVQECKDFIDSLGQFCPDPMEIHLIGGESLIKKGIFELIKHISSKGSRTVITSCGYTIDEPVAKALVESGLSMLNISLDSIDPVTHNSLRGKEDCFSRVMKAIELLSKYKGSRMKLGINTVISAANLDKIVPLIEWVSANNNLDSIYFMAVMRPFGAPIDWQWHKKNEYKFLWPQDPGNVNVVLDKIIAMKKQGYSKIENPYGQLVDFKSYFASPEKFIKARRCSLTHSAININAIGDIYLCFFMESLGNIRDGKIHELWFSEKADKVREKMSHCQQNCELVVNCYYGD